MAVLKKAAAAPGEKGSLQSGGRKKARGKKKKADLVSVEKKEPSLEKNEAPLKPVEVEKKADAPANEVKAKKKEEAKLVAVEEKNGASEMIGVQEETVDASGENKVSPENEKKRKKIRGKKKKKSDVEKKDENTAPAKKKKPRRRRSKKRKAATENPEDDANEAKKAKLDVPDEKMTLDGDLLSIYETRRDEDFKRCLYVMMKNFKKTYYKDPPPIFESAQHLRFSGSKGLVFLVYKTEEEAERMKKVLDNHRLIQDTRFAGMKGCHGIREDEIVVNPYKLDIENVPGKIKYEDLEKTFQTAMEINYKRGSCFANLIYKTKEDAEEAFRCAENVEIDGVKLTVLYRKCDKGKGRPHLKPKKGKFKAKKVDIDHILS